ncbi:unnamed protein product [Malus baccata var. baccata]
MDDQSDGGEGNAGKNPKLPVPGKCNILITSALPYVNNIPRLGTISGCKYNSQLFALSLLCRLRRYIVIYICGTDEYGTATETKAKDENCTPQQIYQCGKLLYPTELKDPRCNVCQGRPYIHKMNHLFLKLPLLKEKLDEFINDQSVAGSWKGLFSNDVQETNIPSEVWRYYLLANRPEEICFFFFSAAAGDFAVSDTFFTWADLQVKPNAELLINLGNFINRVLSFIAKPQGQGYGSIIPDASGAESHSLTKILAERMGIYVDQYIEAMEKVKLKQALKMAMSVSSEGNTYLQESKFWQLYKQDQASCSLVIKTSAGLIYLLACLLEPFMPSFSLKVLKQLNLPTENQFLLCDKDVERARKPWDITCFYYNCFRLLVSQKDEDVEFFRKKFSGSQAERVAKGEAEAKKMAEKLDETKN